MASSSYQNLSNFKGSLYGDINYNGLEYDWEVPDNLVVGSPGGVDTIHHHWTKGFYGRGETSGDIFAGQQQRYISGPYGNLYNIGHTASQQMGYYSEAPDYRFWQNTPPITTQMNQGPSFTPYPGPNVAQFESEVTNPQGLANLIEKYDFEVIDQADDYDGPINKVTEKIANEVGTEATKYRTNITIKSTISPLILFLLFLFAFICFDFLAEAGHIFVNTHVWKGKEPNWKEAIFFAILITFFFLIIIYVAGVPLSEFQA